jgi:type IV secretory pathway VirB10-like protein
MNLTSPVSPVSPIGTTPSTDQPTEVSQSMSAITTPTDNVTAPESVQILTTTMPELMPPPKVESGETQPKQETKKEATTNSSSGTESRQESKPKEEQKEEKKSESKQEVKVPAGKELVPGFGITMSLDILNNGLELQQIQLNDILNLVQEQEYGQQQNILLDFILPDDVNAGLSGIAGARWRSLLDDNPLQSDAFGY